jgi:DNA-repair protein XRCC3
MVVPFAAKYSSVLGGDQDSENSSVIERLSNNIFTKVISTVDKLWELMETTLPSLLQTGNVKLVIIDSIAALFRFEYASEEIVKRSKMLWRQANQLQLLSDSFNVPFVVVNQVSDYFNSDSRINYSSGSTTSSYQRHGSTKVIPALGLTWSNCINVRVLLERTKETVSFSSASNNKTTNNNNNKTSKRQKISEKGTEAVVRKLHVILAPHLPNNSSRFFVDDEGVKDML